MPKGHGSGHSKGEDERGNSSARVMHTLLRLVNLSPEEKGTVREEFRRSLTENFTKGIAARKLDETRIHYRATSALKDFEKQLSKPSQREYYKSKGLRDML